MRYFTYFLRLDWLLLTFRARTINCIWKNELRKRRLSQKNLKKRMIQYVKMISIIVVIVVFSEITTVDSDSLAV